MKSLLIDLSVSIINTCIKCINKCGFRVINMDLSAKVNNARFVDKFSILYDEENENEWIGCIAYENE